MTDKNLPDLIGPYAVALKLLLGSLPAIYQIQPLIMIDDLCGRMTLINRRRRAAT
jgi:hypothetical protein